MKKVIALLLALILLIGTLPTMAATQREVWMPSPGITCGVAETEIMFNKAIHSGQARLYQLDSIGDRYYLGVTEEQRTDGGSNGKKKTSNLKYYSILETDDGFMVLGVVGVSNEYDWDGFEGVLDISEKIDVAYYKNKGYETPYYIINPHEKYTYSGWEEYNDFIFIGNNGGIARISDCDDYSQARFPMIFESKLYTGQNRYCEDDRGYYYYLSDGKTKATVRRIIGIKSNTIVNVASPASVAAADITSENGYTTYGDGMSGNTDIEKYYAFPGNNNKFFNYMYVMNAGSGYYDCVLNIYQNVNGHMTIVQEETCTTGSATAPKATPYVISGLDESSYLSAGISVPIMRLGNIFVLKTGELMRFEPDSTYNGYNLCLYNNKLATIRNKANGDYIYYKDSSGSYRYWQRINYLNFSSDGISIGEDIDLTPGEKDDLDGYYSSYTNFVDSSKIVGVGKAELKEWWKHYLDNKFSDGRYASAHWVSMGNSMYEIWYDIYSSDGILLSTGASGFSTTASSALYTSGLRAFVINDTKLILCLANIDNSWFNEYYRASVVNENDDGIIEVPQPLGKKNILTSDDADTMPVDEVVDFAAEDLPLAFNIKENVIGTNKLNPNLREQVNTIRLDSIVIVAEDGYISGKQNTGITLSSFDKYDYTFGNSPVHFYSNGQYLCWYCDEPQNLKEGTYNVNFVIGEITVCAIVKVITPPANNSSTTVVF